MKPLIPSPNTDESMAWDLAQECSLLDIENPHELHPIFQQQLALAMEQRMPEGVAKSERVSCSFQHNSLSQNHSTPHPISDSKERKLADLGVERAEDDGEWCCNKAKSGSEDCHFCWRCQTTFCDQCWESQPAHRQGRPRNQGGIPHEKSNPDVAKKIEKILESALNDEQQAMLHVQDEDSSWFGTGKDEHDDLVFQDYGRYANIMAEKSARHRRLRYPALVSFVGQTGAGKSTLVRLLIELCSSSKERLQVPVVGSVSHSDTPTSGDVHLYYDPKSSDGEHPVLYADCEGLDGGEREPIGARSRNRPRQSEAEHQKRRTTSFARHIRRMHNTSEREILWATTEETRSREYHVRNLYPRLLYTFSDVIVFVMKNPRVIENVIEQLIKWAAAALETSSNQPVLPHAIIVLNASENTTDPELWDVNTSTIALMASVREALDQNHTLRKYVKFWGSREKSIQSVMSLLLSYYSSVRVVRVPAPGRPKLINEQLQRLHDEITTACAQSRMSKHKVRMLLSSDELQPYLQYAFDHFCKDLDIPFDFVQASFANNPIPLDFGGNILKLAINVMDVWKDKLDGPKIFGELSVMVASCIMLDSARQHTLGPADKVFPEYLEHCDDALDDFCTRHWPCEYASSRGRCVNVKAGHSSKGHQLRSGQVLAVGDYFSTFSPETYRVTFRNEIYANLAMLLEKLHKATKECKHRELEKAAEIHRDYVLRNLFRHLDGSKSFVSHTACFSCLVSPPEHPLPCGHVLCTPCIKAFGMPFGRALFEMRYCPLHHDEMEGQFEVRWPIWIKPHSAGVRILCLDGGGIRGIVELIILQQIERALGIGLPIQSFVDLIVGTSTGGVIGLGLGSRGWSVQRCIKNFESLCKDAFTKRKGIGLPGIEFLVSASNHSRYETRPLETALRSAFGEDSLFGGLREMSDQDHYADLTTKVAVVTTTTNGTVMLLTNYNRMNAGDDSSYQFHRSEKPHAEMKTWEAARATSAAPRIFKPFCHEPSGQIFQDGAIYHNNPVEVAMQERRLIWPDVAEAHPDLVLSIGTSYNSASSKQATAPQRMARWGMISHVKQLAKIAIDHIQSTLNSEQTWRNYIQTHPVPERLKDRYIRLNLPLENDPPKLDDVSAMTDLNEMTRSRYTSRREEMRSIADRLIATSFYFECGADVVAEDAEGSITVTGNIFCRFAPGSGEIRALGETFRKRSTDAYNQKSASDETCTEYNPYFVIQERRKENEAWQTVIGPPVVTKMMQDGQFSFGQIVIHLSNKVAETTISLCFGDQAAKPVFYPISGFPRCLVQGDRGGLLQLRPYVRVSRRRTATTTVRRGAWTLPHGVTKSDLIERYADPEYQFPGDASQRDISEISSRFSPTPTLPGLSSVPNPDYSSPDYYEVEVVAPRVTGIEVQGRLRYELDASPKPTEMPTEYNLRDHPNYPRPGSFK